MTSRRRKKKEWLVHWEFFSTHNTASVMIGDFPVFEEHDENLTIKVTVLRATEGLWELLTCRNVITQLVGKGDLKTYKKI